MKPEERNINCHKRKRRRSARDKMCHFPKEFPAKAFGWWVDEAQLSRALMRGATNQPPCRNSSASYSHSFHTLAAGKNKFLGDVLQQKKEFLFNEVRKCKKESEAKKPEQESSYFKWNIYEGIMIRRQG